MIQIAFQGSSPREVDDQILQYADTIKVREKGDTVAVGTTSVHVPSRIAVELNGMLRRVQAVAARRFWLEVAEAELAGRLVPLFGKIRTELSLDDGKAWAGTISPINKAFHNEMSTNRDLVFWDPARMGYGILPEYAAEAARILRNSD